MNKTFCYTPEWYSECYHGEWLHLHDGKMLLLKQSARQAHYRSRLADWFKGYTLKGRALEMGFNDGKTMYWLAQMFPNEFQIDGIDFSSALLQITPIIESLHPSIGKCFIMDAADMGFPNQTYDNIIALDFIEHLEPGECYESILAEMVRVTKTGGHVWIYIGRHPEYESHINCMPDEQFAVDFKRFGMRLIDYHHERMLFEKKQ